jgi:hypothetical protein
MKARIASFAAAAVLSVTAAVAAQAADNDLRHLNAALFDESLHVRTALVSAAVFDPAHWAHGSSYHWWELMLRPVPPFPELQYERRSIVDTSDSNLVDLRWNLGPRRSRIPTFEIGGCDLVSARTLALRQQWLSPSAHDAVSVTGIGRTLRSKIADLFHNGCD